MKRTDAYEVARERVGDTIGYKLREHPDVLALEHEGQSVGPMGGTSWGISLLVRVEDQLMPVRINVYADEVIDRKAKSKALAAQLEREQEERANAVARQAFGLAENEEPLM
jgi:hypothetical protein